VSARTCAACELGRHGVCTRTSCDCSCLRRDGQRTRAIIAAERLTLDRAERHELAEFLVGHEGSWRSLAEDDARRIADAIDAFIGIQWLLEQRREKIRNVARPRARACAPGPRRG
jgi:hypothetical protein